MNKKDFAVGIIANNIGVGGTLLEFQAGYGQTMPVVPFYLTLTPPAQITTLGNSEKVLVTAKVDNEKFTIVRAQGGTIARDVKAGWIAGNGIYVDDLPNSREDVGLGNVDNTSDLNKPISTATQAALNGKVNVVAGKGLSKNDYTDADKAKLNAIQPNATANSSDAALRDRAQHTGVQPIQTVQGLEQALGDKQPLGNYATAVQGAKADTALQPGSVATVALSGSYADLTEKPYIPSVVGFATTTYVNNVAALKMNLTDVVNNLTSTATDKPLSAEQGRQLKVFIDTINAAITSNDTSLDQLQEIVDFIKLNRNELDNLSIASIAGLQSALDGKQPLGSYATAAQGAKADTAVQPADLAPFETATELGARDTANRERSNHTGSQAISTVAGLQSALDTKATVTALGAHTSSTANPHSVTKAQVGLGNVDNTSDANKPVSTAQQTALNAKANTSDTVNLTGDQTIAGVKTFSSSPVVPTATTTTQAVNKAQMDTADAAHVSATDPHTQYMNSDRGDARYAGQPYAVMAKSQFASLSSSYGTLGRIFGNNGYKNDLQVYGLSTQAGTPTPDVPVPIVGTTGNVTVSSDTKNLVLINATTTTTGGITFTVNADGTVLMNGTASANFAFQLYNGTPSRIISGPTGQTFSLSGFTGGSVATYYLEVEWLNDDTTVNYNSVTTAPLTFTRAKSGLGRVYIVIKTGTVISNVLVSPQLEAGSTATTFEKNINSTKTLPLGTTQLRSLPNGVSDRIYKDGSTWKLEQNVGNHLSNNGSAWSYESGLTTVYRFGTNVTNAVNTTNGSLGIQSSALSQVTQSYASDTQSYYISSNRLMIKITQAIVDAYSGATLADKLNAYLAANNLTINYQLATPVTTTITDPTLITALENIRTYQGVTNITASTPISGSYGLDLTNTLAGKVDTTGDQTIAGVKTFTSAPIAPSGTSIGGALYLTGTGFPDGVVSAPVGSIYIDKAITNGIAKWVKKSGSANTGWRPDDITSTVPATATSTGIAGQRAYDANYLYICTATNTWKRTPLSSW